MKTCPSCGAQNDDAATACAACGKPLVSSGPAEDAGAGNGESASAGKAGSSGGPAVQNPPRLRILLIVAGAALAVAAAAAVLSAAFGQQAPHRTTSSAAAARSAHALSSAAPSSAPASAVSSAAASAAASTASPAAAAAVTRTCYYAGWDFSGGAAWVEIAVGAGNGLSQWSCIDTRGATRFTLDPGEMPVSSFQNGVAVVRKGTDSGSGGGIDQVVDETGAVVFPKSSDVYTYTISPATGGYCFVQRSADGAGGALKQFGIVDRAGNWVLKPERGTAPAAPDGFSGVFALGTATSSGSTRFFDANTGVFFEDGAQRLTEFAHVLSARYAEGLLFLPASGNAENPRELEIPAQAGGYADPSGGVTAAKLGIHENGQGFYDKKGNRVIDLSVQNAVAVGNFSGGYCTVRLTDAQGQYEYTVIDKTGRRQFAPVGKKIGQVSCGLAALGGTGGGDASGALQGGSYLDMTGKTVFTLPDGAVGGAFTPDGIARAQLPDGANGGKQVFYINTKGAPAF